MNFPCSFTLSLRVPREMIVPISTGLIVFPMDPYRKAEVLIQEGRYHGKRVVFAGAVARRCIIYRVSQRFVGKKLRDNSLHQTPHAQDHPTGSSPHARRCSGREKGRKKQESQRSKERMIAQNKMCGTPSSPHCNSYQPTLLL